jgi:hypothetical protein
VIALSAIPDSLERFVTRLCYIRVCLLQLRLANHFDASTENKLKLRVGDQDIAVPVAASGNIVEESEYRFFLYRCVRFLLAHGRVDCGLLFACHYAPLFVVSMAVACLTDRLIDKWFSLVRHWPLYDAIYYSPFIASKLSVWKSTGESKLQVSRVACSGCIYN